MSLVAQALLTTVTELLRGQTWAEDRVLEQPIDPLDQTIRFAASKPKASIAVYVESVGNNPVGQETQRGSADVTMKLVAYMPPSITVHDGDDTHEFDHTGAGFALNVLARQIDYALHAGSDPWHRLFLRMAPETEKRKTRFLLIETERGMRLPAIELVYELKTIPEPEFGRYGVWVEFDAALRAAAMSEVADILKNLIEAPGELEPFEQFRLSANLTAEAFAASGLEPMAVDDEGAAVDLEGVTGDLEV